MSLSLDWTQLSKESVNLKICQWKLISIFDENMKKQDSTFIVGGQFGSFLQDYHSNHSYMYLLN